MRTLLTTLLDLIGSVLIVAAVAVLAAELYPTDLVRGLLVGGVGLLVVSWVTDGAPLPWRKGSS